MREFLERAFDLRQIKMHLLEAIKIGFGAALAVVICTLLGLPHPSAAGTVALLTIMVQTRKQTVSLIYKRLISYALAVGLSWMIFPRIRPGYIAYGLYLFLIVFILWTIGWKDTLSVNAVFGTVFLLDQNFSMMNIFLEFCVLLVGMVIAFVLNLYQPDKTIASLVYEQICMVEVDLMDGLGELADSICGTRRANADSKTLTHILEDAEKGRALIAKYTQNKLLAKDEWVLSYLELCFAQYSLLHVLAGQIEVNPIKTEGHFGVMQYVEQLAESVSDYIPPEDLLETNRKLVAKIEANADGQLDSTTQKILLIVLYNLQDFVFLRKKYLDHLSDTGREEFIARHHRQLMPKNSSVPYDDRSSDGKQENLTKSERSTVQP